MPWANFQDFVLREWFHCRHRYHDYGNGFSHGIIYFERIAIFPLGLWGFGEMFYYNSYIIRT